MPNQYSTVQQVTDTEKGCSRCRQMKPFSDFHKDRTNTKGRGLAYYCKECANRNTREYNQNNKNNPEYRRRKKASYIKSMFGIPLEQYETMLKEQDYKCAICKTDLPTQGTFTHLDHCHSSGKIRKFLCTNCNRGLGHFMDSKENLLAAVEYLAAHTDYGNQKEGTCL